MLTAHDGARRARLAEVIGGDLAVGDLRPLGPDLWRVDVAGHTLELRGQAAVVDGRLRVVPPTGMAPNAPRAAAWRTACGMVRTSSTTSASSCWQPHTCPSGASVGSVGRVSISTFSAGMWSSRSVVGPHLHAAVSAVFTA